MYFWKFDSKLSGSRKDIVEILIKRLLSLRLVPLGRWSSLDPIFGVNVVGRVVLKYAALLKNSLFDDLAELWSLKKLSSSTSPSSSFSLFSLDFEYFEDSSSLYSTFGLIVKGVCGGVGGSWRLLSVRKKSICFYKEVYSEHSLIKNK